MNKKFATVCLAVLVALTSCDSEKEEIKPEKEEIKLKTIDFKEAFSAIQEDGTISVVITSSKVLTENDTVYLKIAGADAVYSEDFTTSLPITNNRIKLVGENLQELSFSVAALFDYEYEEVEHLTIEIDRVSEELKSGTQKTISVDIENKSSLRNDLIAEYLFNGNTNDTGPNGLHGIAVGATLTTDRDDIESSAYYFDGASYIEVANHDSLNFDNNFTLCAWMKATTFKAMGSRIIDKVIGSKGDGFLLDTYEPNYNGNRIRFMVGGNGWTYLSQTDLEVDEWYFVVATYESGVGKVYINTELNVENNSNKPSITTSDTPMRFGFDTGIRIGPDFDDSFVGSLDDIRIYHRVLSQSEAAALYTKFGAH